ncbi:phosphoribosylanthranilate isomerase [Camelimonas abortus]|uniref:N-(5'-phosphoribosyl)anthranilate isomerase n=1 Tax=Camelimonas abortus TaxID=1017184 RepID=A0ABV7LFR1_9HYPH
MLVKICGVKDSAIVDAAVDAGASLLGFVHFPRSPRHVELEEAAGLAAHARARAAGRDGARPQVVVLTVDPDDDLLARIMTTVRPEWIQLHGGETPARVARIAENHDVGLIKAIGVSGPGDIARALDYDGADLMLLDARPPKDATRPGGNGLAFDWDLARGRRLPPFLLSGGLTPENVGEALARLAGQDALAGVDVSSGVESAPGVKSPALVEAFVRAARRA